MTLKERSTLVKRQTVWLSAMMVFSLMLIGYYTLGTAPATPGGNSVSINGGSSGTPQTSVSAGSSGTKVTTSPAASTPVKSQTVPVSSNSASDWFVSMQMNLENSQSKLIQTLQSTIGDPRASNTVVSQAYSELNALQSQQAAEGKVHEQLVGAGYPDSVVIYNPHGRIHVYVQASKLTALQAVSIINTVSQTTGVQSNLITVSAHA